jgi:DNA-binding CsgD family transcriptional regulator
VSLNQLLDQVRSIKETSNFKQAVRAFEKAVDPLGARYYAIGPMAPVRGQDVFAVAESPGDFAKIYSQERMYENDPLRRASVAGRTFQWADIKPANDAEAHTLEIVHSVGMRNGFASVIAGPGAMKLGVTMAWGEKEKRAAADQVQAHMLGVTMLSHVLYLNELTWRQALPVFRPLDVEILRLASNANVDKEIAKALKVLPEAVHERWRTIRKKLGARDRAHACAIAASIGLIPPPDRAMELVLGQFSADARDQDD